MTPPSSKPARPKAKSRRGKRRLRLPPYLIGRVERVSLPTWGVRDLKAKVDTGARTSSLHVDEIQELGRGRIRFAVVLGDGRRRWVQSKVKRTTRVRSSNGQMERRFIVETDLVLGAVEKQIELSLTGRADMRYRMLLGRLAIAGDFAVDVSRRFIAGAALDEDVE